MSKLVSLIAALALLLVTLGGCATVEDVFKRDKTAKGAGYGAAAGAVLGAVLGEGEADEILAGAAIGAGIGAGVGAYMDRQEAKIGEIPGTYVERVSDDMILVHFDSDVLFAVDSAQLSNDSRAVVNQMAGVLNEFDKTAVVIQGHTDSSGSEEYNQGLSERRADSVRNYLAGRGIDVSRMASLGYGESQPIDTNATPEGRARNRRVNILLKAKAR